MDFARAGPTDRHRLDRHRRPAVAPLILEYGKTRKGRCRDESAAKPLPADPLDSGQFSYPLFLILLEQRPLAQQQANLARIPFRQACPLNLDADELGASAVALLLQPVGEH